MASQTSVAPLQIPDAFVRAYNDFDNYPSNLVLRTTYPAALKAYAVRLEKFASRLFHPTVCLVPILDFDGRGPNAGLQAQKIIDDASLQNCIGYWPSLMPNSAATIKADPKCRFIFLNAESSRKPLRITRTMLHRMLTYHQVMPAYLDFLTVFGTQNEARDLRFSGFREQTKIKHTLSPRTLEVDALARSGRQYQLSYNLKAVACKSSAATNVSHKEWVIRQGAFHHQFDLVNGTALWIVAQGHLSIRDRVVDLTSAAGRPEDRAFATREGCFRTTLTIHLLYCHWSVSEWRWYIQWLEDVIEQETKDAIYGTVGVYGQDKYTPDHIQHVQHREDKTNEAIMVLEANTTILASLRDYYLRLRDNPDFDLQADCAEDTSDFAAQINDMIYDAKMQLARAKVLVKITADRKNLILQHLQSQAAVKMENLTQLTIKIGTMSQREAIAMRIITVVTLIYLPATFVSTFFSTDIVKYQGAAGGSFSDVALYRWLQVTLPLTLLTLAIGWLAYEQAGKAADKEFEDALFPSMNVNSKASPSSTLTSHIRRSKTWLSNLCC